MQWFCRKRWLRNVSVVYFSFPVFIFPTTSFQMTNFDIKSIVFPRGSCNQQGRKRTNQRNKTERGIIYFLPQTQNGKGCVEEKFLFYFLPALRPYCFPSTFYRVGFVCSNFMVLRSKCWVWGDISRKSNWGETDGVILCFRLRYSFTKENERSWRIYCV